MKKINVKTSEELENAICNLMPDTAIEIDSGEYYISDTLNINCDNVKIYGKDNTVIKGTKKIDISKLSKTDGIVKINLDNCGVEKITFPGGPYADYWREYDIPKPHLLKQGPPIHLFYDNKKMTMARYPENGYLTITKALGETKVFHKKTIMNGAMEGVFVPNESDVFDNDDVNNFLLLGFWYYDWAMQRHTIESYDRNTKVIRVKEPYHVFGYRDGENYTSQEGGIFYVLNTKLGLKNEGDWYVDIASNTLYMIPYTNQDYFEIAVCEDIFKVDGRSNVVISNMMLCNTKGSAVNVTNSDNIEISNIEAHDLDAWGIITDNCTNTTVKECHIFNTAGGGISSSGGDRNTLKSSNNLVLRNNIHNIACWHKMYMPCVEVNGVGVVVRENNLHDVPNSAIMYQGNNHVIEKNIIRNACAESNDAGAIYAGRDYTCQGTIIRYNYLCDLYGFENKGCIGIYFDDGMCTAKVYGNVLANIPYVAILLGGGRNFEIYDNTFFNCKITLMFDERLNVWTSGNTSLVKHLNDVPYRSEIWRKAYPYLYKIMEDEPTLPKYNSFYNNKIVGGDGLCLSNEKIEKYLEHYENTYTDLSYNTDYIEHLSKWYYIKGDK